jgi:hypothetical protein
MLARMHSRTAAALSFVVAQCGEKGRMRMAIILWHRTTRQVL